MILKEKNKKGTNLHFQKRVDHISHKNPPNIKKKLVHKQIATNNINFGISNRSSMGNSLHGFSNSHETTIPKQKIGTIDMLKKEKKANIEVDTSGNLTSMSADTINSILDSRLNNILKTIATNEDLIRIKKELLQKDSESREFSSKNDLELLNVLKTKLESVAMKKDLEILQKDTTDFISKHEIDLTNMVIQKTENFASKQDFQKLDSKTYELAYKQDLEMLEKRTIELSLQQDKTLEKFVSDRTHNLVLKPELEKQLTDIKEQTAKQDLELIQIIKTNKQSTITKEDIKKLIQEDTSVNRTKGTIPSSNEITISKSDIDKIINDKIKHFATKQDLENVNQKAKSSITKSELEYVDVKTKDVVYKKDIEALRNQTKDMVAKQDSKILEAFKATTSNFVLKSYFDAEKQRFATKNDLEEQRNNIMNAMNERFNALDMRDLTEKYVNDMILKGENEINNNDETSKTEFESVIEPAVARIISKIMKYNYGNDLNSETVSSPKEVNINYATIYESEDHIESVNPIPPIKLEIVEMGAVYKEESPKMFQNELRDCKLKTDKWDKLGEGVKDGNVIDVFLDKTNKKIYIAGHFKNVDGIPMDNIAVYDLAEKSWKHVGEGIPHIASSLAIDEQNEIVYVSGIFNKVGKGENEIKANNIAAFDVKQNKWFPLGEGLDKDCAGIIYDAESQKIYACGAFTKSGDKPINYIGVYDIVTKSWSELPGGTVNQPCKVILKCKDTDELYVGGQFTSTYDNRTTLSHLGKYSLRENKWSEVSKGVQGVCNTMTYDSNNQKLYIGGSFTKLGNNTDANNVAEYDIKTSHWNNMNGGVNNVVHSLYYDLPSTSLFVGGSFTSTTQENIALNYIAKYAPNENRWLSLESYFQNTQVSVDDKDEKRGLDGLCKVVSMDDKSLFIAGNFKTAGNICVNSVARYALEKELQK